MRVEVLTLVEAINLYDLMAGVCRDGSLGDSPEKEQDSEGERFQ
jgi:hypothetical protein